jgi:hypothetical protein
VTSEPSGILADDKSEEMTMADETNRHSASRDFDALLAEMPRIAEAVKAFPEAVQQQAYDALVNAFYGEGGTTAASETAGDTKTKTTRTRKSRTRKGEGGEDAKTRRRSGPSQVRDLDLAPPGKKSFKDFVAEKQPKGQNDRNVVSVYFLIEELGMTTPVTMDHVYTCYRDRLWRAPSDMANSLAITASRRRFIDTADLDDIKLTPRGRNHVEHDLPKKKEK